MLPYHGSRMFQGGWSEPRLARGLWQKNFPLRNDFRIWKKKSFRYLISCLLVLASKRETGSVLISSRRTSLFAEKESQKDNFQAPEWLFLSKEGRSILFFFSGINGKASRLPQVESSNDLCLSVTKLPLRIWKDRSLILFLDDALDYLQFRLAVYRHLNRCYRKRAVYDTTFRWKANSKTAHHYRKITERGTIAKQKSRH